MRVPSREQVLKFCHDNTILDSLGVKVIPTPDGCVKLELEVENRHSNCYDILHGGVLTTMADTAMGAACFMLNKKVVTVSITMEFMHPIKLGMKIFTDAKVLSEGNRVMICECRLTDEYGKLFAKSNATFYAVAKVFDDEE